MVYCSVMLDGAVALIAVRFHFPKDLGAGEMSTTKGHDSIAPVLAMHMYDPVLQGLPGFEEVIAVGHEIARIEGAHESRDLLQIP